MNLANVQRQLRSGAFIYCIMVLAPAPAYGFTILRPPPVDQAQNVPWYVTVGHVFIMLAIGLVGGFAATWATRRSNIDTSRPDTDTPGKKLRLWCGYLGCSDDHVLVQLIADIQFEYHAAIRREDFAAARRILSDGYVVFARTLIVYVAAKAAKWLMKNLKNIFRAG